MERLSHVIIGAFLAGAFFSTFSKWPYYILKGKFLEIAKPAFKIALVVAMISSLAQLATGHISSEGVAENQPAKLAAF